MAKEMMSFRVDDDLRAALAGEAGSQGRSVSNMLEWILRERYSVLTERGHTSEPARVVPVASSPRSVSADVVSPPVHTSDVAIVRPHMKKNRPAVECPTRVLSGLCPDCGTVV